PADQSIAGTCNTFLDGGGDTIGADHDRADHASYRPDISTMIALEHSVTVRRTFTHYQLSEPSSGTLRGSPSRWMTDKLVSEAVGARHVSAGQDGTPVSGGREKAN